MKISNINVQTYKIDKKRHNDLNYVDIIGFAQP